MDDDRLKTLKWHHLTDELDKRKDRWPEGSMYESDHEKQTVTWSFEKQSQAPDSLVWHLTREELWSPKPSEVADRIVRLANQVAVGED